MTTMTMTTAIARKYGYEIVRGAYTGTTDDRLDRWYIHRIDSTIIDRRGAGYATRADALAKLADEAAYGYLIPGEARQVYAGWVWVMPGEVELHWSKRRTEDACRATVREVVERLGVDALAD